MIPRLIRRLVWLELVLFFLLAYTTSSIAADSESQQAIADRLIAEALKPSPLEADLRRLTDEVGGRIPGPHDLAKHSARWRRRWAWLTRQSSSWTGHPPGRRDQG